MERYIRNANSIITKSIVWQKVERQYILDPDLSLQIRIKALRKAGVDYTNVPVSDWIRIRVQTSAFFVQVFKNIFLVFVRIGSFRLMWTPTNFLVHITFLLEVSGRLNKGDSFSLLGKI